MYLTMVVAALLVDGVFSLLGLVPTGPRPTETDVFGSIQLDYKFVLNVIAAAIFAALLWLTIRRGATDPVCGMTVDRARAVRAEVGGRTHHFCSEHCRDAFLSRPAAGEEGPAAGRAVRAHPHGSS
jgi:YHS domain-containing protein